MKQVIRFLISGILFLQFPAAMQAQTANVGIGQWRVYQPNLNARVVADAGDKIYCVTETGFFYYDKEFNSTKTLSKLDGLSDNGISTINYDSITRTLVIAYQNTNLDLIRDDQVLNVNDVLRKSIPGEKTIYHIAFKDKLAYLSCSFGLVVLDLIKLEIRDSYTFLGSTGSTLKVFSSALLRDSVYITTSGGIFGAKSSRNINLSDQKNWRPLNAGLPAIHPENFRYLVTFNGRLYSGITGSGIYALVGTSWQSVAPTNTRINQLNVGKSGVLVSNEYNVFIYNPVKPVAYIDEIRPGNPSFMNNLQAAVEETNGDFWMADSENGLIHFDGKVFRVIVPNGPAYASSFNIYSDQQSLVVLGGGYSTAIQFDSENGFYEFKNGTWQNYNKRLFRDPAQYPEVRDLVDAVRDPNSGKLYIASYANGVIEWGGPGDFKIHSVDNSTLVSTLLPSDANYRRFVQVTDVELDAENNLWVTNPSQYSHQASLHKYNPTTGWKAFDLKNTSEGASYFNSHTFGKVVIDDNGYKWLVGKPGAAVGLVVYDDVNNRFRHYTSGATTGQLSSDRINCIVKDRNGEIWLGTEDGVSRIVSPEAAFSGSQLTAQIPHFNRRALLEDQSVKAMAVDGANRKWMGTDNGVWLFSPDGDEQIYNFTTDNSPLPSNKITDIAVNHASGDVFIGTEGGLVSFRAGATVTESLNCAQVYPNPVRPGFSGQIGISGLANNGTVKITDVTGRLVFETKATGGTAIWNGRDLNGKKVRTGVYLVMSSNADGDETCMSKVAVVE